MASREPSGTEALARPDSSRPRPSVPAPAGAPRRYVVAKRLLDLTVATTLLLLASPVLLIVVLLIKADSRGPAFYAADRVGRGGKHFPCYKLRTMRSDLDDSVYRCHRRYLIENSATVIAELLPDDPRITRPGRWLRKSSFDELPQLWNVLRGEMSLVGPRPPLPYEVEHYQPWHLGRLAVSPGLSGYWQVHGRGQVTFDAMCRMDLAYIERRSIMLDLWILAKTPAAVLSGRGAG